MTSKDRYIEVSRQWKISRSAETSSRQSRREHSYGHFGTLHISSFHPALEWRRCQHSSQRIHPQNTILVGSVVPRSDLNKRRKTPMKRAQPSFAASTS